MKKVLLLILIALCLQVKTFALEESEFFATKRQMSEVTVYSENNKFWLKDNDGNLITEAGYNKIIRLGNTSWIVQKRNKFGLIDSDGNYLIKPKYRNSERILGKYVRFGNDNDYGLYDEFGNIILSPEYSRIDLLFGGMFLTYKEYKYGVVDSHGNELLPNKFDDIYMPKPNIMHIQYNGKWYEIEQVNAETLTLPAGIDKNTEGFRITELITNPIPATGYSVVTTADYFIKIFSSISPAYEDTIDELMLSKGADTVSIFMQALWLPKFPYTYVKNYYKNVRTPNNGPFSGVKDNLKQKMN